MTKYIRFGLIFLLAFSLIGCSPIDLGSESRADVVSASNDSSQGIDVLEVNKETPRNITVLIQTSGGEVVQLWLDAGWLASGNREDILTVGGVHFSSGAEFLIKDYSSDSPELKNMVEYHIEEETLSYKEKFQKYREENGEQP